MKSWLLVGGVNAAIVWLGLNSIPFEQKIVLVTAFIVLSAGTMRLVRRH